MSYFKRKIFLFLGFTFFLIVIGFFKFWIYSKNLNFISNRFIIGDSHGYYGLNGESLNAYNLCRPGHNLVSNYWYLKRILSEQEVDTVILAIGPHSLMPFQDNKFIDSRWSSNLLNEIKWIIPNTAVEQFNISNTTLIVRKIQELVDITKPLNIPFNKQNVSIKVDKQSNISEILRNADQRTELHFSSKDNSISKLQISYLDSIIEITNKFNTELLFVIPPVSKLYYQRIPKNKLKDFYLTFSEREIDLIDYLTFPLEINDFRDADHLNLNGRNKFSLDLKSRIMN